MMNKPLAALAAAFAVTALAAPVSAQLTNSARYSIEFRGGVAEALNGFREEAELIGDIQTELERGRALGAAVTYHASPHLGFYLGYSRSSFRVRDWGDLEWLDRGFNTGVRLSVPVPAISADPFVRAGMVYNRLGTESGENDRQSYSDGGWGFEVGGGLDVELAPRLSLTPQVTYSRHRPRTEEHDYDWGFHAEHARAEVGLRLQL